MGKSLFTMFLLYMVLLTPINSLYAQTIDLQSISNNKKQFGFSFERPLNKKSPSLSTFSGVYQLNMNIPISSKLNLVGDIPFINTSYSINYGFGEYKYSQNGMGNIFVGLQTNRAAYNNLKNLFTFGLYLPTASEKASYYGVMTDYYYMLKYVPNSFGIYFNYALQKLNTEGFKYGFEIGPNLLIPTNDNGASTELLIHYGINGGYQIERISVSLEFVGIMVISEDIQPFSDRFINMLNIGIQWNGGVVNPFVFYKYYLREEIRQSLDGVLGLGVNVSID